jgi:alpha-L-fucosidase 2
VTCGAWIALSLWEALLYSDPPANDLQRTLNIFRKIVLFFIDYIWEDNSTGYVHTGPTTSPENSYRLKDLNDLGKPKLEEGPQLADQISFLSFSPAIDISILRQVSNVFSILVDTIGARKDLFEYNYQDDLALSKRFGIFLLICF